MSTLAYLSFADYILQNGIFGKVSSKQVVDYNNIHVGANQSTEEDAKSEEEKVQEAIDNGGFIPPWEYVEQEENAEDRQGDGYLKIKKKTSPSGVQKVKADKYFWCEDLKNWCTYTYWYSNPVLDCQPSVWTGFASAVWINVYRDARGNFLPYRESLSSELRNQIEYELFPNDDVNWYQLYDYSWKSKETEKYYYNTLHKSSFTVPWKERRGLSVVSESADGNTYTGKFYKNTVSSYNSNVGYTQINLCVWNGRDAFIPITSAHIRDDEEIHQLQNWFLSEQHPGPKWIIQHRGTYFNDCDTVYFVTDENKTGNVKVENPSINDWYFENNEKLKGAYTNFKSADVNYVNYKNYSPVQIIHGRVLTCHRDYTVVDKDNFQCVRPGKPYFQNERRIGTVQNLSSYGYSDKEYVGYESNECTRAGLATGNPAIYRLPTGELLLCTTLIWGGMKAVCGKDPVDFLNDFAIKFFGDGRDKTIHDHWLHNKSTINTDEETPTTGAGIVTEDTVTLKADCIQMPVKEDKTPDLNISFNVNDVNVSVEETFERDDYLAKW